MQELEPKPVRIEFRFIKVEECNVEFIVVFAEEKDKQKQRRGRGYSY